MLRFAAFMTALAILLLTLDHAMKLRHRDGMSKEYYSFPKDTFDVVFLGSSLPMYGILPLELYEQYGIASYNLSTGNQSLGMSYYLAKEAIEKDHPSLIVLDCSRAVIEEEKTNTAFVHYATDIMPYTSPNRISMIRDVAERKDRNSLLFPLIAYHSRWQEMETVDVNVRIKEGLYGSRLMVSTNEVVPFDEPEYLEGSLPENNRVYLEEIIQLCRESGTSLLLMSMPIPGENDFFDQIGYNYRWSLMKEVGDLARSEDVEFLGYVGREKEIGIDLETDVFDGEHLNRWGAAKFSSMLGKHIVENYDVPDRRGAGGVYDRFEEDLKEYPVCRMQSCLCNSSSLRRIAETLIEDAHDHPVGDAVVLLALNGKFNHETLGEISAERLLKCGLKQNLYEWDGHGWLAVLDGGKVVYESDPSQHETEDFADSTEGAAGVLQYSVSSGVLNEETGEVGSGASICVNRLEYTLPEDGLYCIAFNRNTGELLDACRIKLDSSTLGTEHYAP